jgi:hypothetical protein
MLSDHEKLQDLETKVVLIVEHAKNMDYDDEVSEDPVASAKQSAISNR